MESKRMIVQFPRPRGREVGVELRAISKIHFGKSSSMYEERLGRKGDLLGFFLPSFQRHEVWTDAQKRRFIESVFMGFDLGRFVVHDDRSESGERDGWLIDGQQRLTAIRDFLDNKVPVFNDIYWFDIESGADYEGDVYQTVKQDGSIHRTKPINHWQGVWLTVVMIQDMSLEYMKELYFRLNYGGTAHTEDDLRRLTK